MNSAVTIGPTHVQRANFSFVPVVSGVEMQRLSFEARRASSEKAEGVVTALGSSSRLAVWVLQNSRCDHRRRVLGGHLRYPVEGRRLAVLGWPTPTTEERAALAIGIPVEMP